MVHLPFIVRTFRPFDVGTKGEKIALDFLKKRGLKILAKNYRFKKKEIDIIAKDKDTICFIEVKTRTTEDFGFPEEAVDRRKIKNLLEVAISYLKRFNLMNSDVRFDIISIFWNKNKPKIDYIKDAFIAEE